MRLTKLKLAGFKSFVEPTLFHVPSRVVAIVGPNGCGKSNLIDAVRWVMGENAARQLRGESMEDVIFNGSANRKPVGQATIELIFDNSAGRLGGAWARYSEIAIKRVISRGEQSAYYLNGSRCRRRDITDIFLGTGLGPRSYAIIEQGLISRVIESRPEDLRVFLEEAAGISRYKERRRETENRIRHTQDNLTRLGDLRDELERQLRHLQRQARNAEKYRDYRTAERICKARLLALRWQALDAELQQRSLAIAADQTTLDGVLAGQRRDEAQLAESRERRTAASEQLEQTQQHHYQLGTEISRAEQALEHQRQLRARQQSEHDRVEAQLAEVEAQLTRDGERLDNLATALAATEVQVQAQATAETVARRQLAQAEQALHQAQQYWEHFNQQAAAAQRQAEVERTRIEQLERQRYQTSHRRERLHAEMAALGMAAGAQRVAALQTDTDAAASRLQAAEAELQQLRERRAGLDRERETVVAEQRVAHSRLQTGQGRLTSLRTLQEAALGGTDERHDNWLRGQDFGPAAPLAERIEVAPGWEAAVEVVLEDWLNARCVDRLTLTAEALAEAPPGSLRLVQESAVSPCSGRDDSLAARVTGAPALQPLLATVRVAEDLTEALVQQPELGPAESLVTRDGVWLGRCWLRLRRGRDGSDGVLGREREIRALERQLEVAQAAVDESDQQLQQRAAAVVEIDAAIQRCQAEVNQSYRAHARCQEQLTALVGQQRQQQERRQRVEGELSELAQQFAQTDDELQAARQRLAAALAEDERYGVERCQLNKQREELQAAFDQAWRDTDQVRTAYQQQALQLEQLRSQRTALQQSLARLREQHAELGVRRQELAAGLVDDPEPALRTELARLLEQRLASDAAVAAARQAVAEQDARVAELERNRAQTAQQAQKLREQLERLRLVTSETGVRRQHLEDQLAELETEPQRVLTELPDQVDEATLTEELARLGGRIQRLGPINLAAIDEYRQNAERKEYLDSQDADLREALATLEAAMMRIDRETRSRFQETFERLNGNLKTLFPRLFGGGQAFLELTGTDTLDAGVVLMARPPGKRIGHIQLLSGGEKALSALALIFAIFQLNPAPFCLLDEVDAPLDDANVGRFGRLVQELSERVQFVIVTHNKVTMELAQQLVGVTMYEPGVSRLVAVDVDEAVRLAAV